MSASPDYRRNSPQYKERTKSRSRSPLYRRHNGHRSPSHYSVRKSYYQDSDSDREYGRRDIESPWEHKSRRTKSRSRDRERYHKDRDYDSHKDREYRRRSRSSSRWERKSEERKVRDRDRSYRDDDRDSVDSERSPNGAVIGASGSEIIGYKSQPPNNTIMIRGLAQHITENDLDFSKHSAFLTNSINTDKRSD